MYKFWNYFSLSAAGTTWVILPYQIELVLVICWVVYLVYSYWILWLDWVVLIPFFPHQVFVSSLGNTHYFDRSVSVGHALEHVVWSFFLIIISFFNFVYIWAMQETNLDTQGWQLIILADMKNFKGICFSYLFLFWWTLLDASITSLLMEYGAARSISYLFCICNDAFLLPSYCSFWILHVFPKHRSVFLYSINFQYSSLVSTVTF